MPHCVTDYVRECKLDARKYRMTVKLTTARGLRLIGHVSKTGQFWTASMTDAKVGGMLAALIADVEKPSAEARFVRATNAAFFRNAQTASRLP